MKGDTKWKGTLGHGKCLLGGIPGIDNKEELTGQRGAGTSG